MYNFGDQRGVLRDKTIDYCYICLFSYKISVTINKTFVKNKSKDLID